MKVKAAAERISSKISSPMIVDQYEYLNRGPVSFVRNRVKNWLVLNQSESSFLDFKRKTFPLFAKDRYFEVADALKRKDKVELIRYLSVPLYDIVKIQIKEKTLPFKIYTDVSDVQLVQARICQIKSQSNQTWHQMTVRFSFIDQGKDIIKYNVFERRESDSSDKDWRICRIE